ncbi:MAG: MFS transporter [Planctomycetota bacterium]
MDESNNSAELDLPESREPYSGSNSAATGAVSANATESIGVVGEFGPSKGSGAESPLSQASRSRSNAPRRTRESAITAKGGSAWEPLANPVYRSFWIASFVSNVGSWMHEIGAGWLMTELDASPQMVSAVRTAMALPIVLLAIPAGVLADRIDRRRLLLATQTLMLLATGTLALLTVTGWVTSWLLLAMTFLIGLGLTLHVPTWQASMPELVPRSQLPRAIALGSVNFNLARAFGPALAGILVALTGAWIAFTFNAVSFIGVVVVLLFWKRGRSESTRGLSFRLSLYQGLRFAYRNRQMRHVLIRVGLFIIPASAVWALLPLVARERLNWGADGFGILVTAIGGGALIAAKFLPSMHRRFGFNRGVAVAMLFVAVGLTALALTSNRVVAVSSSLLIGCGWMMTLTTLNTAAQITLPSRLRARGMSCYLTAMALSMSLGSFVWGTVAEQSSIAAAQLLAAFVLLVAAVCGLSFSLSSTMRRSGGV